MGRWACPRRGRCGVLGTRAGYGSRGRGRICFGFCSPRRRSGIRLYGMVETESLVRVMKGKKKSWQSNERQLCSPGRSRCEYQILQAALSVDASKAPTLISTLTSPRPVINRIHKFLVGFAQDASLWIDITLAILCFLAVICQHSWSFSASFSLATYSGKGGKCS